MSRRTHWRNVAALVVVLTLAVLFHWIMSTLPRMEGTLAVSNLRMPATIARDALGVPHISARTQRDAYFALGWVHAQDRFWQMELQRRIAAGRLSEIFGARTLDNDRFMRTLGLRRRAEAALEMQDSATRDALGAYADGVNAWIGAHRLRLPPQMLLLGVTPEPWSPVDSLAFGRVMALQLSGNWHEELNRARLAATLDQDRLADLLAPSDGAEPVTLPPAVTGGLLERVPDQALPRLASNVAIVDGSRSRSGKPLLANDPHLAFDGHGLWYLATIDAPSLTLAGATIPGMPFHVLGHNFRLAWGMTTTHADTSDLYAERLVGEDSYLTPEGPAPFTRREEVIAVRGAPPERLLVRETRHGPVMSDLAPAARAAAPGTVLALSAAWLREDDLSAQALLRLNRAADVRSARAALRDFHAPVQNFAYADSQGGTGFSTAGRIPVRRQGDGRAIRPGETAAFDWTGWIAFDQLPHGATAPASPLLVNANNKVVADSYPHLIAADWPDASRARRLLQRLEEHGSWDLAGLAQVQMDEVSLPALALKPLLQQARPGSPLAAEAAALVARWDGRSSPDRPEPLIFWSWMEALNRRIFADELAGTIEPVQPLRPELLARILTRRQAWCDDGTTPAPEECASLISQSLDSATAALADRFGPSPGLWRWGDAHRATFSDPVLARVPGLGWLAKLDSATGGDDFTINRGGYGPGFAHRHGPGLRAVYDLNDLAASRFVIASGQSENPLSRHYGDFLPRWLANDGVTLPLRPRDTAELRLVPQR